jgi:nucleoprotein TPR
VVIIVETIDMSRQVQSLLSEIDSIQNGPGNVSDHFQNQEEDDGLTVDSGADEVIDKCLVIVKSIPDLQEKNRQLLSSLRTLSKQYQDLQAGVSKDNDLDGQLEDAQTLIQELNEQVKLQALKVESYSRERDQWRRIADGRGNKGNSSRPATPTYTDDGGVNYEELYRQMQSEYDAFRREVGTDTKMLKSEINTMASERNDLQLRIAKVGTLLEYEQERYGLQAANTEMIQKENGQLRDRITQLFGNLERQDQKMESIVSEMLEAKDEASTARGQVVQVKTERDVARASEGRVMADYQGVVEERQKFQKLSEESLRISEESDRTWRVERTRMEERVDRLSMEIRSAKKDLADVKEDRSAITLRRENDAKDYQTRIDRLTADTQKTREDLAVSRTKEANLTERSLELSSRLMNAEGRLDAANSGANGSAATAAGGEGASANQDSISELRFIEAGLTCLELNSHL